MIEVRCTHCNAAQKADENKYEMTCKKCKQVFVIEDGIENAIGKYEKIEVEDGDFDTLVERGRKCLNESAYGGAKVFFEHALAKKDSDVSVWWDYLLATLCTVNIDDDVDINMYLAKDITVLDRIAKESNISVERAESDLRAKLIKQAVFTDSESDAIFDEVLLRCNTTDKIIYQNKYNRYSYKDSALILSNTSEKQKHLDAIGTSFSDILPNFRGKQRPVVGWQLIVSTILSYGGMIAALVLMILGNLHGAIIALFVIGLLVAMFSTFIIVLDVKRIAVKTMITKHFATSTTEIAKAMYTLRTDDEIKMAQEKVALFVGSMIAMGQLTFVGIREGKYIDYYDDNCVRIDIESDSELGGEKDIIFVDEDCGEEFFDDKGSDNINSNENTIVAVDGDNNISIDTIVLNPLHNTKNDKDKK